MNKILNTKNIIIGSSCPICKGNVWIKDSDKKDGLYHYSCRKCGKKRVGK